MSKNNRGIVSWILWFQLTDRDAIFAFFKYFNFYIIPFRWLIRPIDEESIFFFDFPNIIFLSYGYDYWGFSS